MWQVLQWQLTPLQLTSILLVKLIVSIGTGATFEALAMSTHLELHGGAILFLDSDFLPLPKLVSDLPCPSS